MKIESRLDRLRRMIARKDEAVLGPAVDPDRARDQCNHLIHDLKYLGAEWREDPTRPGPVTTRIIDGVAVACRGPFRYLDPSSWNGDPATFPIERCGNAARASVRRLGMALGNDAVSCMFDHPDYLKAASLPRPGRQELALLRAACRSANEHVFLMAGLAAAFAERTPEDWVPKPFGTLVYAQAARDARRMARFGPTYRDDDVIDPDQLGITRPGGSDDEEQVEGVEEGPE